MDSPLRENERFAYWTLTAFLWGGVLFAGYFFKPAFLALDVLLFTAMVAAIARQPVLLRSLGVWHAVLAAFVVLYWMTCLYAADRSAALGEAARFGCVLPLAVFAGWLTREQFVSYVRQWAWAGSFLTIGGWALGMIRDGRLESTIGYANTLAVLLAIGCGAALNVCYVERRIIYALLFAIQAAGLLHTGSRAVIILAAAAGFIGLVRLWGRKGVFWVGAVAGLSVLSVTYVMLRPEGLGRLADISWDAPELSLRRTYWTDGMGLLRDHWAFGLGGGGWAVEHDSWYSVAYLHQFYLQVVLETGIGGLLLFGAVVAIPMIRIRQFQGEIFFLATLSILMLGHVAVDLDFEYPLCFGLFIILFGRLELHTRKV